MSACAFCGRPREKVKRLVRGPRVMICEDCVYTARDFVEGIMAPRREHLDACSYCGQHEAREQYRGTAGVICDTCIGLCVDILHEDAKPPALPAARIVKR